MRTVHSAYAAEFQSLSTVYRPLAQEKKMKKSSFKLKLDQELLKKVSTYYIYRSEESSGTRPIIDGIYIQRPAIGSQPPNEISLVLQWDE